MKLKANNMIAISVITDNNFCFKQKNKIKNNFEAIEIIENLYLGSYADSKCEESLLLNNIKYVLNISNECEKPSYSYNFSYKQIFVSDHGDSPINLFFDEAHQFINNALLQKEKILVHCRMGISRSATIIISYLMNYGFNPNLQCKMSLKDAFRFVKKKKKNITPNFGFCLYLRELNVINGFAKDLLENMDDDSNNSTPCSQ
jgi:protein-tyrosine phosphatase